MRGAPHKGLAWLMRRIRSRMFPATSGLPGRRRDFLVQCQAKARRCQRRTGSGRTISGHRRQPDKHLYNTTPQRRSQRWRRKRRGAFFWRTASWWRSARISACRAAPVRKLEATKAKRARKRELIVVATMISRTVGTPAFSDRTEFSVCTGFLTGKITEDTKFESTDFRNVVPRFTPENRKANQALVDLIGKFAEEKKVTSAQIALAWLLAEKSWIVPIPGTTKLHRLEENIGAVAVELTSENLRELDTAASKIALQGARYPEELQKLVGR